MTIKEEGENPLPRPASVNRINPSLREKANFLCYEAGHNVEYVRGVAEIVIDFTYGINMDDKEEVIEWLVNNDPYRLRGVPEDDTHAVPF